MKYMFFATILLSINFSFAQNNVGIGTITPEEKLHVAGNVKADTVKPNAIHFAPSAGAGKILTSDAAGNASWAQSSTIAGNVGYGLWGDCATNGSISEYQPSGDTSGMANDSLGFSVALSGEFAIVGVPKADVGANANQGTALIYKFTNNKWEVFARLVDPSGAAGDEFGYSVSINGNAAIVGSPRDNILLTSNQGSVCFFQYNGTDWVFVQKLTDGTGAAGDFFGFSVSVSGNKAVVGSPYDDVGANLSQGSVSFYEFNGTNWAFKIKLVDFVGNGGNENDCLGYCVAISGNNAITGAPYADYQVGVGSPVEDAGAVITYIYSGNNWAQLTKKVNTGNEMNERFGQSVALSSNAAIIGEPAYSGGYGRARVYSSISLAQSNEYLITKPTQAVDDKFGNSVSMSGQYLLVGINRDDVGSSTNEGSVSLFTKVGNSWQQLQFITDPSGAAENETGTSVSIDGTTKRFIIGAPGAFGKKGKVLFGKVN